METITYIPHGVCSSLITINYEGDTIISVKVQGGCNGNLQGISSLLKGMKIKDAISRLEGIKCGCKSTSCPDQIANALKSIKQ